tara:strand:- start:143 stop:838 length:696 start_codon:yes stop_codon:yes gene_type:complete
MRDGMRHQAVLVLGFVLLAPMMACGDTLEPLSEIDATVAAKVVEERVAEATVEAKLQAMAKTIVEATAQAVPTATPISPSPTPIPVPKIFTDSGQSFGNSGSVSIAKGDLDSDSQQPTSLPSPALPDKLKHPRLDSRLNKLVGQIGSRSAADIAGSAPVSIGDLVAVTIRLSHNSSSTVDFLKSVGAIVANVGIDYIETYTPVTVLVPLAEKDGVLKVEAIIPSEPAVTDQ